MSRSGRIPIAVPENTEVKVESGVFFAKGKLGELSLNLIIMLKLKSRKIPLLYQRVETVSILRKCGVLLDQEFSI